LIEWRNVCLSLKPTSALRDDETFRTFAGNCEWRQRVVSLQSSAGEIPPPKRPAEILGHSKSAEIERVQF